MSTSAADLPAIAAGNRRGWAALWTVEDWWSIWIGLGLVVAAVLFYRGGVSLQWLAVTPPAKWRTLDMLAKHVASAWPRYLALFALWAVLFGAGARALGLGFREFVTSFAALFVVSIVIYGLGQWEQAARYNLEPPLVALALGLLISNTVGVPQWLRPGLRVEFYVKTGIVLLGAGVPLALILWAGPVAIGQAGIVSLVTFGVIFAVAARLGLDRRLAATLGAGGAVCGVSGAIAVAGAVGARREHAPIAITLVIFWAVVMIFLLPLGARALGLPTGIAGAWIGTSEFADAAGLAAAQAYSGYAGHVAGIAGTPEAAINAFTLMKVIGRDVWIGIWAFVLSLVATTRWESTGVAGRAEAAEIWHRFPKFVLGFLAASALISIVATDLPYAEYKKVLVPALVQPLQTLRTWAFLFCFLSIGLTTRFRELVSAGAKPLYAFTAGVAVNLVLGYVLSAHVFAEFWRRLGE
jgi:uncharacterized membrane protein YadS